MTLTRINPRWPVPRNILESQYNIIVIFITSMTGENTDKKIPASKGNIIKS